MKITIKDEDEIIQLDNEDLNNDNFVDLSIWTGENTAQVTVSLDELQSAVLAFQNLRSLWWEKEKICNDED